MNWICADWMPICQALARAPTHSTSARPTSSGCISDHSRVRAPPSEPPRTATIDSMPIARSAMRSTVTVSRTEIAGNRDPHAPPSGCSDEGPVVPRQPPMTFVQMMQNRSVSRARPEPIMPFHQPAVGCSSSHGPDACASPVSACCSRMTFDASVLRRPHRS